MNDRFKNILMIIGLVVVGWFLIKFLFKIGIVMVAIGLGAYLLYRMFGT